MSIRRRLTATRVLTVEPIFFDSIPKNSARNGQSETHFCFEIHLTIRKMLSVGWIESPPSKVLFGFDLSYNNNNFGATGTAVELAREISDVIILCSGVYCSDNNNSNDGGVVLQGLRGVHSLTDLDEDFPRIYREIWEDIGRRVATLAVREKPHVVYVVLEAFTVKGTEHLDERKEEAVQRVLRNYYS